MFQVDTEQQRNSKNKAPEQALRIPKAEAEPAAKAPLSTATADNMREGVNALLAILSPLGLGVAQQQARNSNLSALTLPSKPGRAAEPTTVVQSSTTQLAGRGTGSGVASENTLILPKKQKAVV